MARALRLRSPLVIAWLLVLVSGLARAECDNSTLADQLTDARVRYSKMDEAGFRLAVAAAHDTLACLGQPVRRSVAADWHRVDALLTAVDGRDKGRVVSDLRAAMEIDPTISLFPGALPESYWTARYAEARALSPGEERVLAVEAGALVTVDGMALSIRREALPALVQCGAEDGTVLWTSALQPGEDARVCAPRAPAPLAASTGTDGAHVERDRCDNRISRGGTWGMTGGVLALAGASAGLVALNGPAYERYQAITAEDTESELYRAYLLTRITGFGAIGAGAGAGLLILPIAFKGCF